MTRAVRWQAHDYRDCEKAPWLSAVAWTGVRKPLGDSPERVLEPLVMASVSRIWPGRTFGTFAQSLTPEVKRGSDRSVQWFTQTQFPAGF